MVLRKYFNKMNTLSFIGLISIKMERTHIDVNLGKISFKITLH